MAESFQAHADKMQSCMNQLRNIQASLEYWKTRQGDETNEWLLQMANDCIERAAKRIYSEELMGR